MQFAVQDMGVVADLLKFYSQIYIFIVYIVSCPLSVSMVLVSLLSSFGSLQTSEDMQIMT